MRFSLSLAFLVSALLAVAAEAQNGSAILNAVAQLPTCAVTCILSAVKDSPCGLTNTTCICNDSKFESTTESCITGACSIKDTLHAKAVFETTCDKPVRDHSAEYVRLTWVLLGLTTFVVAARLIYKYFSSAQLGLDDLFTFLAYLAVLPSFIINLVGILPAGLGKDIWTLTPHQIESFGYWFYIVEPMYFVQMGLVKMAILCFYMRIFDRTGLGKLLWGTAAFNAVNTFVFLMVGIFQCTPIHYYWTRWDGEHRGTCININAVPWANAIISIVLDLWILYLPLSRIRTLNLHWWKKLAVTLMFCVGTFVTVVSILRLQSLVRFANSLNPTWDQFDIAFWTCLEVPTGIICCCLPAIRLILIQVFPKLFGMLTKRYDTPKYAGSPSSGADGSRSTNRMSRPPLADSSTTELQLSLRGDKELVCTKNFALETHGTSSLYGMQDLESGSAKNSLSQSHRSTSISHTSSSVSDDGAPDGNSLAPPNTKHI
ncbi:CFEM domain-containing protein [Colletotrichum orchidophilum]|uniref:CFEM domain-containing protein n=1 Tax=Colletotrichum orchidophilum TaxID=1209926 RepID=A0A1G4AY95_9PEZI|nr:CFEM domain-containing protein [Colletotrichum orchidophilum]OHE94022.1 CFEM domain-containing protein [Colletotrichum orchidophilum]